MNALSIDINADLGEGIGNEAQLMPFISSCNIACGGHAGSLEIIKEVVALAKKHEVKIGAHPSFPDRENFGRIDMDMSCADLYTSLKQQISVLLRALSNASLNLHHIKPHGALYNKAAKDEKTALVIIEVVKSMPLPVKLYAPYNSVIANCALAESIPVCFEGFADRHYNDDLSLVSRKESYAIIEDSKEVFEHVFRMISQQKIMTKNRIEASIKVDTICVHGDTPNSVNIARNLYWELCHNNVQIQ